MLISCKVHYDYTQANTKVNNSYVMINIFGKIFSEHSQKAETDQTLWEPDNVLQTLCASSDMIPLY